MKDRFKLSKRHEKLIESISEIPSIFDISTSVWNKDLLQGINVNYRYNTEDLLLMTIELLTKGTQMEDSAKELVYKARLVFDYYEDNK